MRALSAARKSALADSNAASGVSQFLSTPPGLPVAVSGASSGPLARRPIVPKHAAVCLQDPVRALRRRASRTVGQWRP
jgi:hypothetical protein